MPKPAWSYLKAANSLWVLALEVIYGFAAAENEQVLHGKCKNVIADVFKLIYKLMGFKFLNPYKKTHHSLHLWD